MNDLIQEFIRCVEDCQSEAELKDILTEIYRLGYIEGAKSILEDNIARDQETLDYLNGETK